MTVAARSERADRSPRPQAPRRAGSCCWAIRTPARRRCSIAFAACAPRRRTSPARRPTSTSAACRCSAGERRAGRRTIELVDLPGLYSLDSRPAGVARRHAVRSPATTARRPAARSSSPTRPTSRATCTWSASSRASGVPFVVALNMIDLAHRRGLSFDLDKPLARDRRAGRADRGAQRRRGRRSCWRRRCRRGLRAPADCRARCRRDAAGLPQSVEPRRTLEAWAETVVARERRRRPRGGRGERHAARPARRRRSPTRSSGCSSSIGVMAGLFWSIFAARHRADGPDRGDLRPPRRRFSRRTCRPARCATCWSAASSAASRARSSSCRRSACSSFSSRSSRTPAIWRARRS